MNRMKIGVALVAGMLLTASATAQFRRPGFRPRPYFGRPYYYPGYLYGPGFGFGLGFGAPIQRTTPKYRNAFTGDVGYAENATNTFRAQYERRKGDPLGIKSDVQRLDETLEKMQSEAESFGSITIRGTNLYREAMTYAEAIDARVRAASDESAERWAPVMTVLRDLAKTYRIG